MKKIVALFLAYLVTLCCCQAEGTQNDTIKVGVSGCVRHSGWYRLEKSATIEQAFARAGGWTGEGDFGGAPSKRIWLVHHGKHERIEVRVHVNRETKQILVLDEQWKAYQLAEGDIIALPMVVF